MNQSEINLQIQNLQIQKFEMNEITFSEIEPILSAEQKKELVKTFPAIIKSRKKMQEHCENSIADLKRKIWKINKQIEDNTNYYNSLENEIKDLQSGVDRYS